MSGKRLKLPLEPEFGVGKNAESLNYLYRMEVEMRYLICIIVIMLLVGCGQGAEEKAVEKVIETQMGEKADVDVDNESMRIKTKDGEMSITSGKSAKIPEEFPKDIPMYKGFALDMAMEVPRGYSLSFTTEDEMSKVSEWYLTEMINQGWTKETLMDMGKQTMMLFKKGERGVNLVISPDNEQTRISLTSVKG